MAKSIFQISPLDAETNRQAADLAATDVTVPELPAIPQLSPVPAARPAPATDTRAPGPVGKPSAAIMRAFEQASVRYDVPINVLMALGEQESRYNPMALGTVTQWGRAKGLMQYLDGTAAKMGINPFDPVQSIDAAAKQLRDRLSKGYSMADAVKEHFAGPDRSKWGTKTARYGQEVLGRAARLRDEFVGRYQQPGPWYSPGATPGMAGQRPVPADAVRGLTRDKRPPVSIGLTDGIENPNAMKSVVARYESEKQRLPNEGNLVAPAAPEPTFGNALRGAAISGKEAFRQTGEGIRMQFQDLAGDAIDGWIARNMPGAPGLSLAEQREHQGKTNSQLEYDRSAGRAQDATPQFESWLADAAYGGLQSLIQTTPGVAAGVAFGPGVGLAVLGGQTEAQSYAKYRARGATPGMALLGGVGEGAVEVATERLPMGWFTDKFGKVGFGEFLTQYLAREMPTEQLATFAQDAIDTAIANPDKTWGDFWDERLDAAGKTAVATLMQTGAFAGVNSALRRVAQEDMTDAAATDPAAPVGPPETAPAPAAPVEQPAPVATPSGPLGRAMARAPIAPAPPASVEVPEAAEPGAALKNMTLVTEGTEYPVQLLGETGDAVWVKAEGGEELQIPRADIDAGRVALVDPTVRAAALPAINAQPTVEPKEIVAAEPVAEPDATVSAAEPAGSDIGFNDMFQGLAAGMSTNLIDMYHAKAAAGSVKDASGTTSPILQVAKKVRDRRGGEELTRAEVEGIARAVDRVGGTGVERQAALRGIVDQFAPEVVDKETGEIIPAGQPAVPDVMPTSTQEAAAQPATEEPEVTEQQLRDRLKYLSSQARTNNGWTKPMVAEKKKIMAAIDGMGARTQAGPADMAAPTPAIAEAEAQAATSPLNDLPEPTEAQKEAGNYKKGHIAIGGLNVSIENPAGTSRRPEWPPLKHTYGYVKRSEGADGDHVDVFLGPKAADPSNPVFIVDQVNSDGSFDEHKVMVGFADKGAARRGYLANYEKGWQGLGDITEMPFADFQSWVKDAARTLAPAGTRVASASPSAAPIDAPNEVRDEPTEQAAPSPVETVELPAASPPPPEPSAAPPTAAAPQQSIRRTTDKKNPNPYVRAGERYTFSADVDYVRAGETYEIETPGKRNAYFRNVGSGAGTSLNNYHIERALKQGLAQRVGEAPVKPQRSRRVDAAPVDQSAQTLSGDAQQEANDYTASDVGAGQAKPVEMNAPSAPPAASAIKASAGPAEHEADKHRKIEEGFAANRAVLGNFKKDDAVEFDVPGTFTQADGTKREGRTVRGVVTETLSREQGTLKVTEENGGWYNVPARNLRPSAPEAASTSFAGNKLFTADKVEAARARLRDKMNRINSGVDPEVLIDGMTIAGAYIEAGVRKFADYAAAMRTDFGTRITPYLLSFWEGARNYPGLDTKGMSSVAESRAHHASLLDVGLPAEEATALGTEIAKPKKASASGRNLRADWGVDTIDGWTPIDGGTNAQTDFGLKGGLKDAFLSDATSYMRSVAKQLAALGFVPHVNAKGKNENPVARNAGGPAVPGDVTLHLAHPDTGANVFIIAGGSGLRGAVPTNAAGVSLMYRVSRKEGDKQAKAGVNRWAPVDLSAVDLADTIAWEVGRGTPELKRDHVREPESAEQGGDRGRVPSVSGERGRDPQSRDTSASADVVGTEQPENVGEPDERRADGEDGVRSAGTDVAPSGRADGGRDAGDGRARAGRARGTDAGTRERASELAPSTEAAPPSSPARSGPGNFHISNPLEIVGGGPVARFDRNRQAIETYHRIRDEGRQATPEEQRILAGYTGWGSFGQELFQGTWDRAMPKDGWQERDKWLRDQMGKEEWESAQRSITNAHYTDPPTVMAMWAMMERMGFNGGRVLEPSMGIGNFFGMMPAAIAGRSQLAGIELDSLTGGMAKLLYPDANVRVMGYQDSATPDGFYDAVIGNWPFENTVIADRRYDRLSPFLHDYFFLKAVDQVRAGGIVMGITSSGSMDKKAAGIRRELAKKAELVAAYRLPSGAFAEYAGTKVVTDIVILRKRPEPIALADKEGWIESVPYRTPNGDVSINEYFVANPSHVIGTIDFGHGTTRGRPGMIVHRPDNMAEQLATIAQTVPQGVYSAEQRAQHISYVANHTADREGALTKTADGLFIVRGEQLAPAGQVAAYAVKDAKKTAERVDQLDRLVDMRQKYAALIDSERSGDATAARKALQSAYSSFTKAHGKLGEAFGLAYLRKIDDPFYPALAALEIDGKPAAVLSRSTTRAAPSIDNPTIAEAFVLERNSSVNPSLDAIAARAGVDAVAAKAALLSSGAVFELANGDVVPADMYLSGNVREKLRQAKAAVAEGMDHLQRNVDALTAVVPADVPYFKIETQLGATWVSPEVYGDFVGHMLGLDNGQGVEVRYNGGRWTVRLDDRLKNRMEARTGFGTGEYGFQRLVNAAFSNQTVTIRRRDSEGAQYVDAAATEEVNGKISEMRTKFADWLWSDPERRVNVEAEYNEVRNAFATPKFDGSFLRFEGMALSLGNGPFDLRQHQADAIWRALVSRRSLNAHEVGTGKTFTMAGIAVESRRYGIARKPLILAHNANSKTVAAEIQQMYPASKILYIDNLSPSTIDVKMRQIRNDDWDAVVVPHSLIDRFAFKEDTLMDMAREEIAALEEEAYAAAQEDGVTIRDEMWEDPEQLNKLRSITAKELVKMRQRIIENIKKQSHRASREGAISFEELGVDMLMVDEAHEFKKPPISTRMKMKGLNTQTSNRSIALSFMTRYVRAQNAGGNVHLFTGTPITNTLTEVFHMMRYIMQEEMQAAGVDQWDGWFGSFAREVMDVEQNAAAEYEAVTRLAGFINVPELRRMIGQYMDVVFAEDMPEMQPRRTSSGKTMADELTEAERAELLNGRTENAKDRPYKKVINVTSDLTDAQKTIFEQLRGYARAWRSMSGKERKDAMAAGAPESPIITEGLAAKASFDVRLYDGEQLAGQEGKALDDPGSKASRVVANVKEIYDSHPLATQVVFAEQGFSNRATRSLGRDADGNRQTRTFPTFSTIRDIVDRLAAAGIPREQIAIVDGSTTKDKRKEIALAMNAAQVRVVVGSTDTLGVGVNMQKNLRAMHHMDAPWMPGDLEQRNGRGQRQGNQWNTVLEYRYLTDRLDGRRWQVLAIKQRFITAFLKADDSARTIEGEAAADEQSDILQSFAEAAGDPRILIREKLRKQLDGVQRRERLHTQGIANAISQARMLSGFVAEAEQQIADAQDRGIVEKVARVVSDNAGPRFSMVVGDKTLDARKDADEAIDTFAAFNMRVGDEPRRIGAFGGHDLMLSWPANEQHSVMAVVIEGQKFQGGSVQGLEQSLRRYGAEMAKKVERAAAQQASIERLRGLAQEPFHMGDQLALYEKQLADLETDIKANPVPPPAWLRAGAPVETTVNWKGTTFNVSGHRWTSDGWFVLATDERGAVSIPYMEAKDAQGIDIYDPRPFEAPEVIEKEVKSESGQPIENPAAHSIGISAGGFAAVEGLRQHLDSTNLTGSITALLDAGRLVLHANASTLPASASRAGIRAFLEGEPVVTLTGEEFAPDGRPLSAKVTRWYADNGHAVVEAPGIGPVALDSVSVKNSASHGLSRAKASAFAAVPDVLKHGRIVHSEPLAGARDGGMVHFVAAPIRLGEQDMVEIVMVRSDTHAKRMYVHEVALREVLRQPAVETSADAAKAGVRSGAGAGAIRTILHNIFAANPDGSLATVQGMTSKDGRIHLVADQLTSRTALPVLLHEMFHAGVRPLIGNSNWTSALGRVEELYRSAALREATGDRGNSAFWRRALDRVDAAHPPLGMEVEEFAAYAIEERAQAPAGIREAADRLVGALKAWMLRRFGVQLGSVTPAQLQALATSALRAGVVAPGTEAAFSRVVPQEPQIDAATPGMIANLVTKAMDGKASVLGAIPLRPLLSEMASRIPAAQEYLQLKQAMDALRDRWHARSDAVAQPWLKFRMLHRAENAKLMDLMHEATLEGVDPEKAFTSILTAIDRKTLSDGPGSEAYDAAAQKATRDQSRKASHGRLEAIYSSLSNDAKRVYVEVRDTYKALSDAFEQTLLDNLSKALDIKFRQAKRAYDAELIRIAESNMGKDAREVAQAQAEREWAKQRQLQGWAKGARMTRLRAFFETNNLAGPYFPLARFGNFFVTVRDKESDQVISFSRFEKPAAQQAFAKEMKGAGHGVTIGVLDDGGALRAQVDARFVTDIESILEGADVSESVRDAVWQRWLESMPDMSIRTSRIHRKGRAGFSTDAVRAFGHHMFHGSHQLARLKYALDLDETIALARDQAKTMPDPVRAGLIVNEMARRNQFIMNPTGGPLAQALTSAAFVYHLSVSPAAALVNTAQTAVLGVPILAAYDGRPGRSAARAAFELNRALRDFAAGRGTAGKAKGLTPAERDAMEQAYETGLIERTQSHDLAGVGETGVEYSPVRTKVMGAISWAFHHTERMNREITFLAAYRMARKKGEPHNMAIDRAAELTWKTHFDYQNTSRPRVMQSDTAKVLLTFRNFQVNMLWRLFRDTHQAIKGGTAQERREARAQLAGVTGMMMLTAGLRGTWLYGIAMLFASLLFGDDAEDDFSASVVETLGRRLGGMTLNGVPGDVLGIDISERVGMPDLWFRSPDRQLEGATEFDYWAMQILGASVGILRNLWTGVSMIADGKTYRGVETIMPKFAKDLMRSTRYMQEGALTLKGDPIMENMPPSAAVKQALGFTPAELAERYDQNRSMKNKEQRILDERRAILSDYDVASRGNEDTSAIEAHVERFNAANPDYPIVPRSIRQSMRSRAEMRDRKLGGVYLNPKLAERLREEAPPLVYEAETE
ncbi:PLxRFG domain-containing protein [Sphingobium cupriresistens]|uniref:PLxRFG domain-containing protein n=1 Tax=Sphingobium cupriresistens TaxID=1132417 RepID=UPI003BF5760A